jgi:hypothetical protein
MLPAKIAGLLPDHDVTTVKQAGFTGLDNGKLINRAMTAGYTVLVTADQGLPKQRNIAVSDMAVVLVPGSRLRDLAPLAEQIGAAIREARPGTVVRVTRIARRDSAE